MMKTECTLGWGAHAPRVLFGAPRPKLAPTAFTTLSVPLTPKPSARRRREHAGARVLPVLCEFFMQSAVGLILLFACILLASPSDAQTIFHQQFTNLNLTIPDNDPSGAADVRTIRGVAPGSIVLDVNVTLKLAGSGARNGDLYATLDHQSGYTILLNRVGRRLGNAVGYEDAGLEVTFDDEAANGDIHLYRATLFGNHDTSVRQSLASIWAGDWAPDGRNVDPDAVSEASARRASLGSMKGLPSMRTDAETRGTKRA